MNVLQRDNDWSFNDEITGKLPEVCRVHPHRDRREIGETPSRVSTTRGVHQSLLAVDEVREKDSLQHQPFIEKVRCAEDTVSAIDGARQDTRWSQGEAEKLPRDA